jgi:hypothetical protein
MGKSFQRRLNHVIFLGAGASYTSGYPIGQKLRLMMASKDYFQAELEKIYPTTNAMTDASLHDGKIKCLQYFDRFAKSIELFRHGGFATVDEFSKLASESYPEHVQAMKKLMCFVLAAHNPEKNFHESDYYAFIQRLFRDDALNMFRNEITVITFNYDCYLDYVMRQAYSYRLAVSKVSEVVKNHPDVLKGPQPLSEPWSSKLSSGFFSQEGDKAWAWRTDQFNYYKLHGSITYGGVPANFGYDRLFAQAAPKRFAFLDDDWFTRSFIPPVVFPWELFDSESGRFISEDDFIFARGKDEISKQDGKKLFNHFKIMWENAKLSVEQADKISFVGLSMHEYLEGGLRFLFQDFGKTKDPKVCNWIKDGTMDEAKPKRVEVVVANPENDQFRNSENRLHPASLCGRVADVLKKVAPNLAYVRSSSENDGVFRSKDTPDKTEDPDITPRFTFREFIEREMD